MRREPWLEPRLATAPRKPIAEPFNAIGLAELRYEVDEMPGPRGVNAGAQRRQDGQFVGLLYGSPPALGFGEHQLCAAVLLHLWSELRRVGNADAGVKENVQQEPPLVPIACRPSYLATSFSDQARCPSGLRLFSYPTSRAGFFVA